MRQKLIILSYVFLLFALLTACKQEQKSITSPPGMHGQSTPDRRAGLLPKPEGLGWQTDQSSATPEVPETENEVQNTEQFNVVDLSSYFGEYSGTAVFLIHKVNTSFTTKPQAMRAFHRVQLSKSFPRLPRLSMAL